MNNFQTGIAVSLAIIVVGVALVFPGFSPFNTSPQTAAVSDTLDTMNTENTGAPTPSPTSLQVTDVVVGTGTAVEVGDSITVHYVGMLADGTVFDASANHGGPAVFSIGVGQVIAGWDQGLIGMKEGGKRKLVIPSDLGYGSRGFGNVIPPDATLTFEIELVKVEKGSR
jgi:peptidylprolyl isomerase